MKETNNELVLKVYWSFLQTVEPTLKGEWETHEPPLNKWKFKNSFIINK